MARMNNIKDLPRLNSFQELNLKCSPDPEEELWKLLQLEREEPNPKDQTEAVGLLKKHHLENVTNIFYCPKRYPKPDLHIWHHSASQPDVKFDLEAFTKSDYSIGYRSSRLQRDHAKFDEKQRKKHETREEEKKARDSEIEPPNQFRNNRSAAVTSKLSGLNKARQLGCVTAEEMETMAGELSLSCCSLWLELDDENSARYATVYEPGQALFGFAVNDDPESWKKLFDHLFERRAFLQEQKSKILAPLMDRLKVFPASSTWSACRQTLDRCIKNLRVVHYCENEDAGLHALKLPFVDYLWRAKKLWRGVAVKMDAGHDLMALEIPEMTLLNLKGYMEAELPDACPSRPEILHSIQHLRNQKHPSTDQLTMIECCYERGKVLAPFLFTLWRKFCQHFFDQFRFDVASIPHSSLSSLSYNAIWSTFNRNSGHYDHGLEKTKTFYEDIIRSHSHGGFSFSCVDKLDAGQPLHPNSRYPAETLMELDIMSSYGFAASSMSIPTGFCVGFSDLAGDQLLKRTDKISRHKTFEFRSVYYTVWKLLEQDKVDILQVFSNFHRSSFVTIAKHILDLCVVTTAGKIMLFQFDGRVNIKTYNRSFHNCDLQIRL